jgi:putative transposase
MRKSWDTNVKHYYRLGLEDNLPYELNASVPNSNKFRWKHEPEDKYVGCELAEFVNQEIELLKRIGQSSNIKKINESYFKLVDSFHEMISDVKGIKSIIKDQKELVINTIESVKDSIPIDKALKVFNISRTTYQNYKTIVIHKCEASYFKWCTKRFPNQLLPKEVLTIKAYMKHVDYMFWSKSSVYLRAVRDNQLHCCISTFYKYCRLLGFANLKRYSKLDDNKPLRTTRPNVVWCADVTIFKTADGVKHYIHVLMDHFSKKILGFSIEKSSSGKAIRNLLQHAYLKYKPIDAMFLTDGGCENINADVSSLLESFANPIIHKIAQRDVVFSNSMIEAFNKTFKYEFLYPKNINTGIGLKKVIDESIPIYNNHRPQWSLDGNTPSETFSGIPMDFSNYKSSFSKQKAIRLTQNKDNSCRICF